MRQLRQLALPIILTIATASTAVGADRDKSLLRLVSTDVGICVELHDLRTEAKRLRESEVFRRIQHSQFYRQWIQSAGFSKLTASKVFIENFTQQSIGTSAANLFGESVVLAIYPRPKSEPTAVLMTTIKDQSSISKTIALWNHSKSVTTERLSFNRQEYFRRTETKKDKDPEVQFYVIVDKTFALSDREEMIQQVISRSKQSAELTPSVLTLSSYQNAKKRISTKAIGFGFFNPRAWDKSLTSKDLDEPGLKQLWQRLDAATISLVFEDGIIVDLIVHYRGDGLPSAWSQFLQRTSGAAKFTKRIPKDAIAVFAGRFDLNVIENLITTNLASDRDKQQFESFRRVTQGLLLGNDLFTDVLTAFGPDWGAFVVPRRDLVPGAVPVDGMIAFSIPNALRDENQKSSSIRKAIDNGLTTGLNFLTAIYNGRPNNEPATVQTQENDSNTIRWMDSYGPYQPAYSITESHLIFASSPKLVAEFINAAPQDSALRKEMEKHFPTENQILFLDLIRAREFLAVNRDFFVNQAVKEKSISNESAAKRFNHLQEVSKLFDSLFVAAHAQPQQIRFVAGAVIRNQN